MGGEAGGGAVGGGVVGVLVMAHGTPGSLDEVEAFYTRIRRGREPSPEQVAELRARYEAIGGVSPLLSVTRAQVAGLAAALGEGFVCELGQKHAAPFVEDGAAALVARGVRSVVGLVLAPHYSALSVGEYHERAAGSVGPSYAAVDSWHLEPGLVSLWAERVRSVREPGAVVLFTAHSLPERVRAMGDPYEAQVHETAAAVALAVGLGDDEWQVAWQSAGRTPEPWLGPSLLEVLPGLGGRAAVVCPLGFTSDHLEVLYDVDVEAAGVARSSGVRLSRAPSLNDDPAFCEVLAGVVRGAVLPGGS